MIYLFCTLVIFPICFILVENYVNKYPKSSFSRWWRKYIVGEEQNYE